MKDPLETKGAVRRLDSEAVSVVAVLANAPAGRVPHEFAVHSALHTRTASYDAVPCGISPCHDRRVVAVLPASAGVGLFIRLLAFLRNA